MRRMAALLTGVLLSLLAGCFASDPMRAVTFKDRFQSLDFVNTADLVQMEVRLIETRYGDDYVNGELWEKSLDEGAVDFNKRMLLKQNGVRVGQVAGAMPSRLQEMLVLERCCVNPRRLLTPPGKPTTIHLGPVRPEAKYQLNQNAVPVQFEFSQAQFSLVLVPIPDGRGSVLLRFTPKVEHGEDTFHFHPTKDRSGLMMEIQRPNQVHSELGWEVTLAPNTYLVVGGRLDVPSSFGAQAFVTTHDAAPRQRILVLRTAPTSEAGVDAEIAPCPIRVQPIKAPPLAQQACQPTARANHP